MFSGPVIAVIQEHVMNPKNGTLKNFPSRHRPSGEQTLCLHYNFISDVDDDLGSLMIKNVNYTKLGKGVFHSIVVSRVSLF